jgi:hypothetical protein
MSSLHPFLFFGGLWSFFIFVRVQQPKFPLFIPSFFGGACNFSFYNPFAFFIFVKHTAYNATTVQDTMQRQNHKKRAAANKPRRNKATRVDGALVGPGLPARTAVFIDWKTGRAIEDVKTKKAIHSFVPAVEVLAGPRARVSWAGFPSGVSKETMRVLVELEWSDNSRTRPFPWIEPSAAGLQTCTIELPWEKRDDDGQGEPDRLTGARMVVCCPEILQGSELLTKTVDLSLVEGCTILLAR